jgi:DNA-binding NtrC family response regulator
MQKDVRTISPDVLERLRRYPFPGNVRELQSIIERAVTFCDGDTIAIEHLPARIRKASRARDVPAGAKNVPPRLFDDDALPTLLEMEARYIRYVVDRVNGNKRHAAALLGIGRGTLYRRLSECPPDEAL